MDNSKFAIMLIVMALSTYLVRAIPFTVFRKKLKNRFLRSVFAYLPYSVLSAMTIPAIFYSTGNIISASVGFLTAVILSLLNKSLIIVAVCTCLSVLLTNVIIMFL